MKRSTAIALPLATLIIFGGVAPANAVPVRWEVADGGNGHSYEAIAAPGGITWYAANANAIAVGAYLVTITSQAENDFVFDLVDSPEFWHADSAFSRGPWIGAVQPAGSPEPGGNWQWVTGEPWVFSNWEPAEPNNFNGDEDRVHFMVRSPTGRDPHWNDESGYDARISSYVVEVPEPATLSLLALGGLAVIRRPKR